MRNYTYLALGDSYTIGEGLPAAENFPSQAIKIFNSGSGTAGQNRLIFGEPTIIAQTGWTTDELDTAIEAAGISQTYDVVSLLIGVNNQYRGRSVNEYKIQFDHLLQSAIIFAGNKVNHVFVLSIPDWGVTPFAEGQNRQEISGSINSFNATALAVCAQYKITFIDITTSQRANGDRPEFLAPDGLHPSAREYAKWAKKLVHAIQTNIQYGKY